jgi:ubiquinone/menaquinone biosynthesis C-methylase UbiE
VIYRRALLWAIPALLAAGIAVGGTSLWRRPSNTHPAVRERAVSPLFEPSQAETLLEAPDRDAWQKPDEIVAALKLQPGETVADIGAGSGYLISRLSRAVGSRGTVYAQEIQQEFLPALERRAESLGNVRVILGTAEDPRLPEHSVDCFVLLTVYHEVQKPVAFLKTLHRYARPGARLAIIDFDAARRGSPPAPTGHDVPEADVLAEARAAGWELSERHEFISSQFFLVFRQMPDAG